MGMNQKQKHRYLRRFIKEKKVTDGYLKSGLYGAMFDFPKKIESALKHTKNDNHRDYILRLFHKLALLGKSNNSLQKIFS